MTNAKRQVVCGAAVLLCLGLGAACKGEEPDDTGSGEGVTSSDESADPSEEAPPEKPSGAGSSAEPADSPGEPNEADCPDLAGPMKDLDTSGTKYIFKAQYPDGWSQEIRFDRILFGRKAPWSRYDEPAFVTGIFQAPAPRSVTAELYAQQNPGSELADEQLEFGDSSYAVVVAEDELGYTAFLPYEMPDGSKKRFIVNVETNRGRGDCPKQLRPVARDIFYSLEPNPKSTQGEAE